jgi:hypothetical protein
MPTYVVEGEGVKGVQGNEKKTKRSEQKQQDTEFDSE